MMCLNSYSGCYTGGQFPPYGISNNKQFTDDSQTVLTLFLTVDTDE